jgi:hypothetical protein
VSVAALAPFSAALLCLLGPTVQSTCRVCACLLRFVRGGTSRVCVCVWATHVTCMVHHWHQRLGVCVRVSVCVWACACGRVRAEYCKPLSAHERVSVHACVCGERVSSGQRCGRATLSRLTIHQCVYAARALPRAISFQPSGCVRHGPSCLPHACSTLCLLAICSSCVCVAV